MDTTAKLSSQTKEQILGEVKNRLKNMDSQAQMARLLNINTAQLSRLLSGEVDNVLGDDKFLMIAKTLEIDLRATGWQTAKTPIFIQVTMQLEMCQQESISAMLVDEAGIGKTHTAKEYVKTHRNAVYIDCSQVKTKQLLIREIARKFGVQNTGRYADVYNNLILYINSSKNPLIILDEGGDLAYPAFLELKALWNATEGYCGYYMMGADGLKAKVDRNIEYLKVGYTELFRRFGERYQKISPVGTEEMTQFKKQQLNAVAKANKMNDVQKLYASTSGSLTRLKIEFLKQKQTVTA